jgi:tetratricopeptide (TPR) repeat protein
MPIVLTTALVLAVSLQSPPLTRADGERLAREGRTTDALAVFEQMLERDPADAETRLWVARLDLRLGRTEKAEAGFRAVLRNHPADIDALVGLGATLTRRGQWREALEVLQAAARTAGENADLHSALARAYRRAGDDRQALAHFSRARQLAPTDPDVVDGFEAVAHAYGHAVMFEGFGQQVSPSINSASGSLTARVRALPRLHLEGQARVQYGEDYSDALGGAGLTLRAGRATTVAARGFFGDANVAIANHDLAGDIVHYAGMFELGGNVRHLSFTSADVIAVSPTIALDGGRWRVDARYTYSRSHFVNTDQKSSDHSVMWRQTWRGSRRVWLNFAYAYGIESFEDLTADRLGSLGASTAAVGMRIGMPSLTVLHTTWEHQWRSNDTTLDRVTVALVQSFP